MSPCYLPVELLARIIRDIHDPGDLISFSSACKVFRQLCGKRLAKHQRLKAKYTNVRLERDNLSSFYNINSFEVSKLFMTLAASSYIG